MNKMFYKNIEKIKAENEIVKVLSKELNFLAEKIFVRLELCSSLGDISLPKPILRFGFDNDLELHLYTKCYFFIYSQWMKKIFKITHLIYPEKIPDGSLDDGFSKYIKWLRSGQYDFVDKKIISILKENANSFILARDIRNSLKTVGNIKTTLFDGSSVFIIFPCKTFGQSTKQYLDSEWTRFYIGDGFSVNLSDLICKSFIQVPIELIGTINDDAIKITSMISFFVDKIVLLELKK